MSKLELTVFVSSPGDVGHERGIAGGVLRTLKGKFDAVVSLVPIFWEHEAVRATATFQEQIKEPADCDIVVCILWAKLGTRLPPSHLREDGSAYESGTAYEFERASAAFALDRSPRRPDLLVYRKTAPPMVDVRDQLAISEASAQWRSLEDYLDTWFRNPDGSYKAAFTQFEEVGEFEEKLELHLEKLIEARLDAARIVVDRKDPPRQTWLKGSPYRGLQVFECEHAEIFHGRTRAIEQTKRRLERRTMEGTSFLLVYGASGSGKSSLVRAGLLPTITEPGAMEGVGLWAWCITRPSAYPAPMAALVGTMMTAHDLPELAQGDFDESGLVALLVGDDPELALRPIERALQRAAARVEKEEKLGRRPSARLLVVVDQLEELLTMDDHATSVRDNYVRALGVLARSGFISVVATVRSEFFHRCSEIAGLAELKDGLGSYELLAPSASEIAQMIRKPAWAAGLSFGEDPDEGALDDVLLAAAAGDPASLPLLEFVLDALYDAGKEDRQLGFRAYRKLGGLAGAIAHHADEVLASLSDSEQAALPSVLRSLMTVRADGAPITTKPATEQSITATLEQRALVDEFEARRLFIKTTGWANGADGAGQTLVRVAHEALLTHWHVARELAEHDREFLEASARVRADAKRWTDARRNVDYLLPRGKRLAEAEELTADQRFDRFDRELVDFIEASSRRQRDLEDAERHRLQAQAERDREARKLAEQQRDSALRHESRFLAILAELETLAGNSASAIRIALQALPANFSDADRPIVLSAEGALSRATLLEAQKQFRDEPASTEPLEAKLPRMSVDAAEILRRAAAAHGGAVEHLAISQDGSLMMSASRDRTAMIWETESKESIRTLEGHRDWVVGAAFAESAARVATASWDRTARLWDVSSGECVALLEGHRDVVVSVQLVPDGSRALTASWDGTARIWDGEMGKCVRTFPASGSLRDAVFTESYRFVMTVSRDSLVRVWEVDSGHPVLEVAEPGQEAGNLAIPRAELSNVFMALSGQKLIDVARVLLEPGELTAEERRRYLLGAFVD